MDLKPVLEGFLLQPKYVDARCEVFVVIGERGVNRDDRSLKFPVFTQVSPRAFPKQRSGDLRRTLICAVLNFCNICFLCPTLTL